MMAKLIPSISNGSLHTRVEDYSADYANGDGIYANNIEKTDHMRHPDLPLVARMDDVIPNAKLSLRQDDRDWDAGSIACIFGPFIALFIIIIVITLINKRLSVKNKNSVHHDIKMKSTDMKSYEMYKPTTKDQSKIELYSPPSHRNITVIKVSSKQSHRKTASLLKTKTAASASDIMHKDKKVTSIKSCFSAPTLVWTPLDVSGAQPASFSTVKEINVKSDSSVCSCHTLSNNSLTLTTTNSRNSLILPSQIKCCHCRLRELHK